MNFVKYLWEKSNLTIFEGVAISRIFGKRQFSHRSLHSLPAVLAVYGVVDCFREMAGFADFFSQSVNFVKLDCFFFFEEDIAKNFSLPDDNFAIFIELEYR